MVIDPAVTTTIEIVLTPSLDRMVSARMDLIGAAQQRALDQQRAAPNVTTVVAADQLGRFPDGNAAETPRRTASGGGSLLEGRLGLFAAGSGSTGSRGSDAARAIYSGAALTDVRIRKYLVERDRAGINTAANYHASDNTTVFLHGTLATYDAT